MKRSFLTLAAVTVLLASCQQKPSIQTIAFIRDGFTKNISVGDVDHYDTYLVGEGEFSWDADQAVYGDNISLTVKVSISELSGMFGIVFGDNTIRFLNWDDENSHVISGPAIGKPVRLGAVDDYIRPDRPFTVSLLYENGLLVYTIDGKELFSRHTVIPPAGKIALRGELEGEVRVYDLICEGAFKPVSDFYTKEFLLNRAEKSLAAAAEAVKDDPNRLAYHFQPPANWNNDPNGMLFYNGYYHMFYQHNPYGDRWDWMHWGHARSADLVHWEHLPITLWPSVDKGEAHCFSGSGYIMDNGKPILFYTCIGHEDPEHWAALPLDNELKHWEKHPANPIIVMADHGGKYIEDWRDPYLFREGEDTYMVIGGHPEDEKGSIMMYKALNPELTKWDFLGTPFTGEEGNWECPNFFKVGDKYVLIYSPHGRVEYYTGTMDFEKVRFNAEKHGTIDLGGSWNYYAPNTLQKEGGRRLLFGWIPGFKMDQGWQGAISLPRDLSIDTKGRLIQTPVAELADLRGENKSYTDLVISKGGKVLVPVSSQFELIADLGSTGTSELGFRFTDEENNPYTIILTPEKLQFGDETVLLEEKPIDTIKNVRLFFDRSVVEIYLNDGLLCATKVLYPNREKLDFEIFAPGGKLTIDSMDVWEMKSIW